MNLKVEIVKKFNESDCKEIFELFKNEWWTNLRTLNETREVLKNSNEIYIVRELNLNRIIGFSRILTDYIFKALIFDVIVKPDFRLRNIGTQLINFILSDEKLKNVKHFELYCLESMKIFYESFGFKKPLDEIVLLRRVIN